MVELYEGATSQNIDWIAKISPNIALFTKRGSKTNEKAQRDQNTLRLMKKSPKRGHGSLVYVQSNGYIGLKVA